MNEISPCKGCQSRYPGCHDRCDAYKEWVDRYHAQQKQLENSKIRWQRPWTHAQEKTTRKYIKLGSSGTKGGIQ